MSIPPPQLLPRIFSITLGAELYLIRPTTGPHVMYVSVLVYTLSHCGDLRAIVTLKEQSGIQRPDVPGEAH